MFTNCNKTDVLRVCAICRQQRDQAAASHASSKQAEDELVERQAELSQQAARLAHESQQRHHLETLLDEGLQVQTQILLGLQVAAFDTACHWCLVAILQSVNQSINQSTNQSLESSVWRVCQLFASSYRQCRCDPCWAVLGIQE